jgi:hypothetical protein
MVIEQTVEIPASHRLTIEVPPEVPAGRTILTFTPACEVPSEARGQSKNEVFRNALRRAHGTWQEKLWENALAKGGMKQRCIPSFCAFVFSNRRFVCGSKLFVTIQSYCNFKTFLVL